MGRTQRDPPCAPRSKNTNFTPCQVTRWEAASARQQSAQARGSRAARQALRLCGRRDGALQVLQKGRPSSGGANEPRETASKEHLGLSAAARLLLLLLQVLHRLELQLLPRERP